MQWDFRLKLFCQFESKGIKFDFCCVGQNIYKFHPLSKLNKADYKRKSIVKTAQVEHPHPTCI